MAAYSGGCSPGDRSHSLMAGLSQELFSYNARRRDGRKALSLMLKARHPARGILAGLNQSMPKSIYAPCIPTRGTKVPAHSDWIYEVKQDGFR
jgi:hypothetical protein